MIIRYSGGNDGVAEYLVTGNKAGREFSRDELDQRVILSGDLSLTNKVIHSIPDKGQERYLHITLSFAEDDIRKEILQEITDEYKKFLMNAYSNDEYNFYAEAHLPKIKNITDNTTGELKTRKPHIHIVIPRVNLVSGKALNPIGDLTKRSTQEQLDAIQEHINLKYGLESPKEHIRDSDNHKAKIISRIKGDFFKENHAREKQKILEKIEHQKINTVTEFMQLLKYYGEVKIRNNGKDNEYYSVKFPGDKKYTNFKNPVFSKSYIENRVLPVSKPSAPKIKKNLEKWLTKTSYEIRFIWSASAKTRAVYKSLDEVQKVQFLHQRHQDYEQKYKSADTLRTGRRKAGNQRGFEPITGRSQVTKTIGVSRLPPRGLAYGIAGRTARSAGVLPGDEKRYLAEHGKERKYTGGNVRRNDELWRRRGIKQENESTLLHDNLYQVTNQQEIINQNESIKEIRDNISPERFLAEMKKRFFIDSTNYKVSYADDRSPRFQVGNRNLNACDFLTKHINTSWSEAKEIITEIYKEQKENKPFEKTTAIFNLSPYDAKLRFKSLKQSNAFLREYISHEKTKIRDNVKSMRKEMYQLARKQNMNYDIMKGIIVHNKLVALELLNDKVAVAKNSITQYHFNWNGEKNTMKAIDNLKKILAFDEDENSISSGEPDYSLKEIMEANKRREQFVINNLRMKDLIRSVRKNKILYISPHTEKLVFIDLGKTLTTGKEFNKENVTLMLEYAREKYGGLLKIKGSEEFKNLCAEIAAEKNMPIIFKPEKYNDLMKEIKQKMQTSGTQPLQSEEQAIQPMEQVNAENSVSAASEIPAAAASEIPAEKEQITAQTIAPEQPEQKTWLNVPFERKDEVKMLGAKWDKDVKRWYVRDEDLTLFHDFLPENAASEIPAEKEQITAQTIAPEQPEQKTWLNVPFERKDEVKMLGAKWDKDVKRWYVRDEDLTLFRDFLPENQSVQAYTDPRIEFKAALEDAGLIIDGLPEMDGELHRVSVKGAKSGQKDGAYKAFLDNHPAGYFENFKTGHKGNWKSSTQVSANINNMTPAEIEAKKQAAAAAREKAYAEKAKEITEQFSQLPDASVEHPYLKSKGLNNNFGAKLDEKGNLILALKDASGNITTIQKISEKGFKRYEKGGKVSGSFMVIGDETALAQCENIFISTGFATSATIHALTEQPVIATFQDSNLKTIAQNIHEQYPEKQIVIFGDDDRHNEEKEMVNSGREKATEAAAVVNGVAVFPQFQQAEKGSEYSDFADLYRERGAESARQQIFESLENQLQQKQQESDEMEM